MNHILCRPAFALALLAAAVFANLAVAQNPAKTPDPLPVSVAKNGFPAQQAADARARWNFAKSLKGEDLSLYMFLNVSESFPTAVIRRSVALASAPDPRIGKVRFKTRDGEMNLDEYLVHSTSRAQGMIVVHKGKIAFEQYPGLRENDNHLWMSSAKTTTSHVIALLEAEGKIEVQKPVDSYVPELKGTAWQGIKVIDGLDMASGLDIEENDKSRSECSTTTGRPMRG